MYKEVSFEQYEKFRVAVSRYYELFQDTDNKSLVFSGLININLGLQDINKIINRLNSNEVYDSSWYYELVVKAYQVLSAFDVLEKEFNLVKSGYNDLYGPPNESDGVSRNEERQKIDYFRALRSLTTAHTLETTDKNFEKFGITKGIYLEDVRFSNSYRFMKIEGDITLEIRTKDEEELNALGEVQYREVWIEKDIVEPVRIILSKLQLITNKLMNSINDKERELKSIKIRDSDKFDRHLIEDLKKAVLKRYPKEIEIIEYENEVTIDYWEIQEIYDFVNWNYEFKDGRDSKTLTLQEIKKNEILQYLVDVQNMELGSDHNYSLSSGVTATGIKHYCHSKISMYLRFSKNYPNFDEMSKYNNDLESAKQSGAVSNETWACLLLKKIEPELNDYFIIEWDNMTLREIYWQYLTALFVRQDLIDTD